MDVLKVVQQLRDLAKEPQNRVTIIKVQKNSNMTSLSGNMFTGPRLFTRINIIP